MVLMRFKFLPEDFKVMEITDFVDQGKGNYFYYWMTKKDLSNTEIEKIFRERKLQISFSGIKDKKAITQQLVCLKEKIPNISEQNYSLEFVGQAQRKLLAGMHKANEFEVVLREIEKEKLSAVKKFLNEAKKKDFPNYFDEQRFGSKEIALKLGQQMLEKNFEQALKTFLCSGRQDLAKIFEENWLDWNKILQLLPETMSGKRKVFQFLSENPKSFERAFAFVEQRLLKRFLKQFQSFLFNQELGKQIEKNKSQQKFVEILGKNFPVVATRKSLKRQIEVPGFREFGVGNLKRQACFNVEKIKLLKIEEDELFSGKQKITISFLLSKGCYATIFLKCLQSFFS